MVAAPHSPHAPSSGPSSPATTDADSALFAAITAYIRAQDRRTLLQCALLGGAAVVATLLGGAAWWPWMAPLLMVGAGAAWGLADRAIATHPSGSRVAIVALTIVRGTSALLGAAVALFVAAVLFAGLFGRVIS